MDQFFNTLTGKCKKIDPLLRSSSQKYLRFYSNHFTIFTDVNWSPIKASCFACYLCCTLESSFYLKKPEFFILIVLFSITLFHKVLDLRIEVLFLNYRRLPIDQLMACNNLKIFPNFD